MSKALPPGPPLYLEDIIAKELASASMKTAGAREHATRCTTNVSGVLACLIGAQMHQQRALESLLAAVAELRRDR